MELTYLTLSSICFRHYSYVIFKPGRNFIFRSFSVGVKCIIDRASNTINLRIALVLEAFTETCRMISKLFMNRQRIFYSEDLIVGKMIFICLATVLQYDAVYCK
jgi:hypothetical protein